MTESAIYHLITSDVWAEELAETALTDSTRGARLEQVGYIHCSYLEQVELVANAIYEDLTDEAIAASELLLLEIDTAALTAEIKVENNEGGDVVYPHVYGAIPVGAVVGVHVMVRDAGTWRLPADLQG